MLLVLHHQYGVSCQLGHGYLIMSSTDFSRSLPGQMVKKKRKEINVQFSLNLDNFWQNIKKDNLFYNLSAKY